MVEARPPVATTVGSPPTSVASRSTMPSTSPACPKSNPLWIASTVLRPVAARGGARSTLRRAAVAPMSAVSETSSPGAIEPPT